MTQNQIDEIVSLYDSELTTKEICDRTGKWPSQIYKVWHRAGLPKRMTSLQRKVVEYRQQGLCSFEIAEILGKETKGIIAIANNIGYPFTDEEKRRSFELAQERNALSEPERIQKNIKYMQENHPEWEYISGEISSDDYMTIKHNVCGQIIKRSAISMRHNSNIRCEYCLKQKREQRETERAKQQEIAEQERIKKKIERFWEQPFTQEVVSFCPACNSAYIKTDRTKYCSEKCANRIYNARHKDRRLRRIKSANVNYNITLERLYERDHGICWICGEECDYNDYRRDDKGSFIVGGNYPSIDHIYPLSKGGEHSWENVKLAHCYCNTLKSDKVVSI